MRGINIVALGGNLTRNPEIRYTNGGVAVGSFGLAINNSYRTSDGETKQDTCFVDIEVWAKLAETCKDYLKKGSAVLVEGFLKLETWTDKESGGKRSKHKIKARAVHFLDPVQAREDTDGEETQSDTGDEDGSELPPF